MLETLFVKDFAIVEHAEIGFGKGLTVVTGETGAGKSLMVDALLLLGGDRADAGVVRHGCERAELTATFSLENVPAALAWLRDEAYDDGANCQIRRIVRSEGGSRAWINGRPATLTQLQALTEQLIEIHGQHEHQALLQRDRQLGLLDDFGGHAQTCARVRQLANHYHQIDARMRTLSAGEDHAERMALLEHQLNELDQVALTPEQLESLEETHKRLANADHLLNGANTLAELFDGDTDFSISRRIAAAGNELSRLVDLDPKLQSVAELLESANIQFDEVGEQINRYRDELELDPDQLEQIENQLATLHDLGRKHRVRVADLKDHADALRSELDQLRGAGESLQALNSERERVQHDYARAAETLSKARTTAAQKLGADVTALMSELGMAGGRFEVTLEPTGKTKPDAQGLERAELQVSANPGQPPKPLRRVASGGELSRISLAIEVAALARDHATTMVFDEVDAGIGGAVAEIVGQKLRRLGDNCQVLCVTHLPQVAAQGHNHLRVTKSTDGKRTAIQIDTLGAKARRDEIARMLGGLDITSTTVAHARQMLDSAGG